MGAMVDSASGKLKSYVPSLVLSPLSFFSLRSALLLETLKADNPGPQDI
jgi:hypothetical protein